jgi:hypothetical protein
MTNRELHHMMHVHDQAKVVSGDSTAVNSCMKPNYCYY